MANSYPVSNLHIKDLVDVSSMLKNIVAPSFGPHYRPVLMTTNTGQVVFTKDGYTVLSSLSLSHPAAKCILESVNSHSRVYGDGCKTVVLYLAELFREIERNSSKLQSQTEEGGLRSKISTSLHKFIVDDLYLLCSGLGDFVIGDQFSIDEVDCHFKVLKQVIQTILNGSFPQDVVDHFGNLISNFIISVDLMNMGREKRNILKACFENCFHFSPNKSYMNSHLCNGLFFHGLCSLQSLRCETKARCVLILCPIEAGTTDIQTEYFMKLPSDKVHENMAHKKHFVELFVNKLKKIDISLIITSQRVPDFALHICNSIGIDVVSCVEQEDIEFISYFTGISPITSVGDEVGRTGPIVGEVESYEEVVYSGKEMLKLVCLGRFPSWQAKSLFLHGPSDGLAQQLKLLIRKCVKALSCLLEGFNHKPVHFNSLGNIPQDLLSSSNGKPMQSVCTGPSENEDQKMDRNTRNPIYSNVICGGGYFEFLLSYMMEKKFDKSCPAMTKIWADILIRMMRATPQTLFSNLNSGKACKFSNFIATLEEAKKQIMDNVDVGFNSKGELSNAINSGVVEILSVKLASLYAAMDLAVLLLRIDAIVGVKRLPEDGT